MVDTKISALPAAAAITGAEQIPFVQSGATVRTTVTEIADYPVTSRAILAATVLARMVDPDDDKLNPYSGAVPQWSSNAASQITSGVLRAPRRAVPANGAYAGSTAVAVDADPNFRYWGTPAMAYGTVYPDYLATRPPLLTGGGSQVAFWCPRISFYYDGQSFEWYGKTFQTFVSLRLRIDGRLVTRDFLNVASGIAAGNLFYFKCDLGSQATRLIEIDMGQQSGVVSFGGIVGEPTASITRGPSPTIRLFALADSIGGDVTNSYSRVTSWVGLIAELFGGDATIFNNSIGGTGYATATPGTDDFITRVPDIVAANPDILFIEGEQNDGAQTAAQLQTLATNLLTSINTQSPKTLIFVIGSYPVGTPSLLKMQHDTALRAATAAANGAYFISLVDPSNATVTGSGVPAWAASTAYNIGDEVVDPNGVPQVCFVAHTSTAAFDQTKWKPTSIFFGTGKAGTPTGNGNADVVLISDGVHPTQRGCYLLSRAIHQGVKAHLRTIATSRATGMAY